MGMLHKRSLMDPLRSLKQPLSHAAKDAMLWARYGAERRRHLGKDDVEAVMLAEARLVREVQIARESMATYDRIDRFIESHRHDLGDQIPDDQTAERMVMFVGQSRSGHSLVGSLIDAHPDAVIAHEIHALRHLMKGRSFADVSRAIKLNAFLFDRLGRGYTGYSYQVPGQHQGGYKTLRVIGDKKGNGTTRLLRRSPNALAWLDDNLPVRLQLINVIRDPFDNIATKATRTGVSLAEAARRFLANARTLDGLQRERPDQTKIVYLDELIATPKPVLHDLLAWLDLDQEVDGYLKACASLVFDKPSRTRDKVTWPKGLSDAIRLELQKLPDLARFADQAA